MEEHARPKKGRYWDHERREDARARPITTLADVEVVVASGRATFEEWLDCARIARASAAADLAANCAERTIASVGSRPLGPASLQEAAFIIAWSYLRSANSFEALPPVLAETVSRLRSIAEGYIGAANLELTERAEKIAELLLLVGRADCHSYTRLCSKLRQMDRPDLGVVAATRAIALCPSNHAAYTTRGATKVDLDLAQDGLVDLERALELEESAHALLALARCCLVLGEDSRALSAALRAVELDDSDASYRTLAATAVACEDRAALDIAAAGLDVHTGQRRLIEDDAGLRWTRYVAAETLWEAGRVDIAEAVLDSLLTQFPSYEPALKLKQTINLWRAGGELGNSGP
jgi:tetratricopeptide (TPR) repeat protein